MPVVARVNSGVWPHTFLSQTAVKREAMKLMHLAFACIVLAASAVQASDARPSRAEAITLACVAADGFTLTVEIDEARHLVRYNGSLATNVLIDRNQVIFDIKMGDETWTHFISRLTGNLVVRGSLAGTLPEPYICKSAAPKF